MRYKLTYIQGTKGFVIEEVKQKLPFAIIGAVTDTYCFLDTNEDVILLQTPTLIEDRLEHTAFHVDKKSWRKAFVPAGINPSLAAVLCLAAHLSPEDILLDPFCGAGTIPITATLLYHPRKVIASDISGKAIDETILNATESGCLDEMMIFRSDIARLKLGAESIDVILTNLPFGIRVGTHDQNVKVYEAFARQCARLLKPGGRVFALTQEKQLIRASFAHFPQLHKGEEFPFVQGGLRPTLFTYVWK